MTKDQRIKAQDTDGFVFLEAPQSTETKSSLDLYQKLCATYGCFPKEQVNMRNLAAFARSMWIVDYQPKEDNFIVRFWSSGSVELTGIELTGKVTSDAGMNDKLLTIYQLVRKTREPQIVLNRLSEMNKNHLQSEIAFIPVTDKAGTVCTIVCTYTIIQTQNTSS